ncbi:M15 family metallopeptidase [Wukongibacter baidiensis]|uniref:M15 family metallopeptidase n=1 Tax=Wukongibacter baidiensis TaxID=1723361 RepID=UPI003D7FE4DF
MKKIGMCILLIFLLMTTGCMEKEWIQNMVAEDTDINSYDITMKRDLLCLLMAYPEDIKDIQKEKGGRVYVVMKSGKKILYDDKRTKGFQEKLANPDLQDMMEQVYPLSNVTKLMDKEFDPGRIRVYTLLKEVYGGSNQQVQSNLCNVKMGYKNYPFNQNNKAADKLRASMNEITSLAKTKQQIYAFLFPASGTFNYRYIAGTNRLSPHSFGIAVDLKRDKRDYWKWASREDGEKRLKSYPREIVEVFERNGFIWGGKWGHFDILHFEYRPELIMKSRYFSKEPTSEKQWHEGVPSSGNQVKNCIKTINEGLK